MLPAFYINLAARTDRQRHMQAELARVGLSAERVEASTPADLPSDLLAEVRSRDRHLLADTELACSFSHRRVWQMMLDRGISAALVLEDDAQLSASLPAALADTGFLAPGFDAIQLETHPSNALLGRAQRSGAAGLARQRLMSSSLGTAGYIISAHWARQLLAHPALDLYAVDKVMFGREAGSLYRGKVWQAVPALVIPMPETAASGVGRSNLAEARAENRRRFKQQRQHSRRGLRYLEERWMILRTFAPTGELWGARRVRIPAAPDLQHL